MAERLQLERCHRIWSAAPHNAFTSLVRFQQQWICAFREGTDHVSHDGTIRVIVSTDGQEWQSTALLRSPDPARPDLRDASLLVVGDSLTVVATATRRGDEGSSYQSYGWISRDLTHWPTPEPVAEDGMWLWSVTAGRLDMVGAGYWGHNGPHDGGGTVLYRGPDVLHLAPVSPMRVDEQYPNEVAIDAHDGQIRALVRRKFAPGGPSAGGVGTALFGMASPPDLDWLWHDTGIFIGGPALLTLPDGTLIAGGRKVLPQAHTALWRVDTETGLLDELITLPSANDNAYPSMVWHNDRLWVSYYSTHEGGTSVYLAVLAAS